MPSRPCVKPLVPPIEQYEHLEAVSIATLKRLRRVFACRDRNQGRRERFRRVALAGTGADHPQRDIPCTSVLSFPAPADAVKPFGRLLIHLFHHTPAGVHAGGFRV